MSDIVDKLYRMYVYISVAVHATTEFFRRPVLSCSQSAPTTEQV